MESKKINQLATSVNPQTSDLTIIGDPVTGVSKKITLLQIANLFATTGTVSSVAVTETGDALTITGSPITSAGTINIGFAGAANQYVRGDGALADFPTSTGGGSSVSYYLNSSVSQGTIGGVAYRELSKEPIIGAGTDITISANGYVASYITDANDPALLEVPGGNFNCELYFSVNSDAHNPYVYAELYKYDGTTFTLLGSSVAVPEYLTNGTTISPYYFAIPVPTSALTITDRLAIRIYANVDTRTVTLHTENSHLCQVVTTFSKGLTALNNLTKQVQYLATGTSGTNFAIVSSGDTHTFNLPVASATNTGKLSNTDWSTFNAKQPAGNYVTLDTTQTITAAKTFTQNLSLDGNGSNAGTLLLKNNTISPVAIGYASINSNGNNINLTAFVSATKTASFDLSGISDNIPRTFTFPNASGTIALTSNLSSYVPYTGATANVDLGAFDLIADNGVFNNVVTINATSNQARALYMVTGTAGSQYGSGTGVNLFSEATDNLSILFTTATTTKKAILNGANLTTAKTFTLPDLSGTLALLEGTQTFSGSKTFSANPSINAGGQSSLSILSSTGNSALILGYVNNILKGTIDISATEFKLISAIDNILKFQSSNNFRASLIFSNSADYSYTFPASSGTIALTSDLSAYLPLTGGTLTGGLSGTTATFSGLGTFYQLTMTGATAGRIFYAQTGGVVSQSGNLNWNETNGMLGVGTPNPSAVITAFSNNAATQFKAAGTAPAFTFSNTLTSASLACVFGLATSANHFITGTAAGDMAIANQSATAGAIVFGTGTAEKMRMSSSGNVGIGVTPSAWGSIFSNGILQVKTSSLLSYNNNTYLTTNGYFTNSGDNYIGNGFASRYIQTSGNHIWENAPNNTSGADAVLTLQERMRITSGGNVGIGTSSPSAKLVVSNGGALGYEIDPASTSGTVVSLFSYDRSAAAWRTTRYSSLEHIFESNGTTERMRITSGGNVLIGGSTDNGYKLDVRGGQTIFNTANAAVVAMQRTSTDGQILQFYKDGTLVGSISTNSNSLPSDLNFKKNINNLELGLNLVKKLRSVSYNHKIDDDNAALSTGFIAQELEQSLTELGIEKNEYYILQHQTNEDKTQSEYWLDYTKMIPILVNAIQEQQVQIEELKALINK